jgi:hypothetical protein
VAASQGCGPCPPDVVGGWVSVSPVEARRSGLTCPPLGSASPQRPSPMGSGSVSPGADEVGAGSPARLVPPSPSSSHHLCSPQTRSPPTSHVWQWLRNPPSVRGNRGLTLRKLVDPPTCSVNPNPRFGISFQSCVYE